MRKRLKKFASSSAVVKASKMFVGVETVAGVLTTAATVAAWAALGHPFVAAGVVCGFILSAAAKAILCLHDTNIAIA